MKQITQYIQEKLHVSKYKKEDDHSFTKGEKIIKVELNLNTNFICLPICNVPNGIDILYFNFMEIKYGHIYFNITKDIWKSVINSENADHYEDEKRIKINNKGYYQTIDNDDNIIIYLNNRDSINFIKNVYLKKDINKLREYFDIDYNDISQESLEFRLDSKDLNKLLNNLQ